MTGQRAPRHPAGAAEPDPGYAVSRLAHSLQSATRAERDGRPADYIVAALIHDIGGGLAPYSHGSYAAAVLRPFDATVEFCERYDENRAADDSDPPDSDGGLAILRTPRHGRQR